MGVHRGWLEEKGQLPWRRGCPGRFHQRGNLWVNSCPEATPGRHSRKGVQVQPQERGAGPAPAKAQQPSCASVPSSFLPMSVTDGGVRGLGTVNGAGSCHLSLSSKHGSNPGQARPGEGCTKPAPPTPAPATRTSRRLGFTPAARAAAPPPPHSRSISWL